ncbi:MAG TPA: PAS domain S-box protein [Acidobacteriaceae bacterium]|jgi:PAS domain S-box-containing protein|nr:PAS domain S-box protein [Acidobacteriaceae bacterium]
MSEAVTITREEYEGLCTSEALFRQVADSAPVLIWLSGVDALCTWFNRPWIDFRGRTLEQEVGNGWAEGVHKEDFDRCLKIYLNNFEKRTPFQMEYRLQRADGEYRWILDHGVPRYADGGLFLGFIGSCVDITDVTAIKQAWDTQQNISKRLGELAAIVESSDDVIISKNLDGIVTSWNRAASRVFGYTAQEMIGQSILKLIPEELHPEEKTFIEKLSSGQRIEQFETRRITKSGHTLDVSLTLSPVRDAQGTVIGASKILRDISDAKRLEQSLLQAEKLAATGRMAATIAHEINNPLEAVMNLLYLIGPTISGDEGRAYLATAESELQRVSHIAKQTLGYYRENASAAPVSLNDIVKHAVVIYEPRCHPAGIKIHQSLTSARKVLLRRGEMLQVVSNLLANSIHALSAGGTICVDVTDSETEPQGVVFSVRDNGEGISPEALPRVFDAFFTTRATIGTGIGLFIAKQLIEGHGGRITIESSRDGSDHGTNVHVFLPSFAS